MLRAKDDLFPRTLLVAQSSPLEDARIIRPTSERLVIVYRANATHDLISNCITERLNAAGRDVNVFCFPKAFSEERIAQAFEEIAPQLKGCTMLMDDTCRRSLAACEPIPSIKDGGSLSHYVYEGTLSYLREKFGFELVGDRFGSCHLAFVNLFTGVIREQSPDFIYIFPEMLIDHDPFVYHFLGAFDAFNRTLSAKGLEPDSRLDRFRNVNGRMEFNPDSILAQPVLDPEILKTIKNTIGVELIQPAQYVVDMVVACGYPRERVVVDLDWKKRGEDPTFWEKNIFVFGDQHLITDESLVKSLALYLGKEHPGEQDLVEMLNDPAVKCKVFQFPPDYLIRALARYGMVTGENGFSEKALCEHVLQKLPKGLMAQVSNS